MSLRGFEKSEVIHNIYSFFKNWIATSHAARNDNFNYTYALKNNFASLNNNVAVAHCVNNSEKSAQGVTTPCYKKRIATPHAARNDNFNYTYALKNNFIIPNLVKTILTSITFDSLSRKIKNPCLTIKKFISKGVCNMKHTKNILKSLLITVMALSLLAVSCKKDEGGSKPTEPALSKVDLAKAAVADAEKAITDAIASIGTEDSNATQKEKTAAENAVKASAAAVVAAKAAGVTTEADAVTTEVGKVTAEAEKIDANKEYFKCCSKRITNKSYCIKRSRK